MFCYDQALSFDELRAAVNSKWNENILEAREGIGGHCLPKDTQMYFDLTKHLLPTSTVAAAINSDAAYSRYLSNLEINIAPPNETITVQSRKKKIVALSGS